MLYSILLYLHACKISLYFKAISYAFLIDTTFTLYNIYKITLYLR